MSERQLSSKAVASCCAHAVDDRATGVARQVTAEVAAFTGPAAEAGKQGAEGFPSGSGSSARQDDVRCVRMHETRLVAAPCCTIP